MHDIRIIHASDFLQTTVEGSLDFEGSRAILLDIAGSADGYDLLLDIREMKGEQLSYADVYRLVGILETHPESFRGKVALLDRFDAQFEKTQFFEASATEKGFRVRAFLDFEEAVRWLHAKSTRVDG